LATNEGLLVDALSRRACTSASTLRARLCTKLCTSAGPFHAPKTRLGLIARTFFYRALTSRPLIGQFEKRVKASASAFELPAY
jgi:hypothetical protein